MRALAVAVIAALGACGGAGSADPCDRSVDDVVDHLVSISDDQAAWDAYGADLFDGCPAKATLVLERLDELAGLADLGDG